MEIYIAAVTGLVGSLLLAAVYFADRYEPEPVELIQNSFLIGLAGQLGLIFAAAAASPGLVWTGPWALVTIGCASIFLPYRLAREAELDERFDGIVYSVAVVSGAVCAIHLNNLPWVMAGSPHRAALLPGAEPDLRDLLIVASSPELAAELGTGLVLIVAAVFVGAAVGTLQLRGWSARRTAPVCFAAGLAVVGFDLTAGGGRWVRLGLVLASLVVAFVIKRRSVFRNRPEQRERDVLIMGLRTVLIVFGASLLAMVLLQAVVEQPTEDRDPPVVQDHGHGVGPRMSP